MRVNSKIVNVIFGSFCISLLTAAACTLIKKKKKKTNNPHLIAIGG